MCESATDPLLGLRIFLFRYRKDRQFFARFQTATAVVPTLVLLFEGNAYFETSGSSRPPTEDFIPGY
jgi:hypothetical protein